MLHSHQWIIGISTYGTHKHTLAAQLIKKESWLPGTAAYLNNISLRSSEESTEKRRKARGGRIDKRPLRFCATGIKGGECVGADMVADEWCVREQTTYRSTPFKEWSLHMDVSKLKDRAHTGAGKSKLQNSSNTVYLLRSDDWVAMEDVWNHLSVCLPASLRAISSWKLPLFL